MKLRNHPQISRKNGFKTWPPLWARLLHNEDDKPIGEVGFLEDVLMMSDVIKDKVFILMKHHGLRYVGFVCFDDARFRSDIYILLKSKLGRSIKEIGDIDISQSQRQPAMAVTERATINLSMAGG
jgi:hypothetical protein